MLQILKAKTMADNIDLNLDWICEAAGTDAKKLAQFALILVSASIGDTVVMMNTKSKDKQHYLRRVMYFKDLVKRMSATVAPDVTAKIENASDNASMFLGDGNEH